MTLAVRVQKTTAATNTFGLQVWDTMAVKNIEVTVNTNSGQCALSGGTTSLGYGVRDDGDHWLVWGTFYPTGPAMNVYVYPAIGINAGSAPGGLTGVATGTARVRDVMLTETSMPVGAAYSTTGVALTEGAPRGLAPRQNLLTYSQTFTHAAWTKTLCTAQDNATVAPDGTTTAAYIVEDTTSGVHLIRQPATGGLHSIYVRAATRSWAWFVVSGGSAQFYVNLGTGEIGNTAGNPTVIVEDAGNGWWRVSALTTNYLQVSPATGNGGASYLGTGVNAIAVWGAQATLGSTPTAYVPTMASAINEGTPRGRAPRQNLLKDSADLTAAGWTDSGTTRVKADDGWFAVSDVTTGGFGQFTQTLSGLTVGRVYTYEFKVRKTSGGTSPSHGVNTHTGGQFRFNTDTGAWYPAENPSGTTVIIDCGTYWHIAIAGPQYSLTSWAAHLYPAVGPHHALPSSGNQSANTTGTAHVKDLSFHEGAGFAPYVATGSVAVNEGAPRGLAA